MSRAELLHQRVREAIDVCNTLLADAAIPETLDTVVAAMVASIQSGGKVLLCGNGGSAADAQHLAAELLGRFQLERRPYPAIALSDNIALMSAVGNDFGFDEVYSRAVQGVGAPGDVLIVLSTSGRSKNVISAVRAARELGMVTVALVGHPDSPLQQASEHVMCVPGASVARIQEGHMLLGHTIFELVERELCDA